MLKLRFGLGVFVLCTLISFNHSNADADVDSSEPLRVLVVGDSLSAAYNMKVELGWVNLLQSYYDEQAKPVEVINASVSGATTAAGLQILPAALASHSPNIVVLALGGNDGLQGKPLKYIRRNLERLVQLCKTSGADVLLMGVHLPPNYGPAYTEPFFRQYDAIAKANGTGYLPFMLDGIATKAELMMADGIHPKPLAQPILMRNVLSELDPLVQSRLQRY